MIDTSAAYKEEIVGDARRTLAKVIIDLAGPDIVYGAATSSGESPYSRSDQLHDKKFQLGTPYATLEHNRWILDGSFYVAPPDEETQVGFESDGIFDGNGEGRLYVEQPFSGLAILQACSVYFPDNDYDGYPVDFSVEVKQGGTAYYTQSFTGNIDRRVSLEGFTVYNPDAIRVTATKWSLPWRRMRIPEIVPGIYEVWTEHELSELSVVQQGDFSALSLPYGTCSLAMDNLSRRFEPRSKGGLFQSIEERQAVDILLGVRTKDGDEYVRVGLFYQYSGGWKTGDNGLSMTWSLVDIIGLLSGRQYIPPQVLPETLEGWIASLVSQLGVNFANRYIVDADYSSLHVSIREYDDIVGKTCGDILLWACQATGTWPRADAETGKLAVEPLWSQGNSVTLDNMGKYPVMKANADIAAIIFTLNDGNETQCIVSGNATASSDTRSIQNPFIKTQEQAIAAAKAILSMFGGNQYEITGRGNPSSEIGDVDTIWLDRSTATTARRMQQTFELSSGVMKDCKSVLLQADGSFLWQNRAVVTSNGIWRAPPGVSSIRLILVGKGQDGTPGTDGTFDAHGIDGTDGYGGLIWSGIVNINEQQTFSVEIGEDAVFGAYSSANGRQYETGYTDISSGNIYGIPGVQSPPQNSGNGGYRGIGGTQGRKHNETGYDSKGGSLQYTVVDIEPGAPVPPSKGALGCAIIYWDK